MDNRDPSDTPLEEFELRVYSGAAAAAVNALYYLLDQIHRKGAPDHAPANGMVKVDHEQIATRIVAGIAALVSMRHLPASNTLLQSLNCRKRELARLYGASAFRDAGFLQGLRRRDTDAQTQAVHLTLLPIEAITGADIELLRSLPRELAAPAYLGLLSQDVSISPAAAGVRESLSRCADLLDDVTISPVLASLPAIVAWMACSYWTADDKHAIKRPLNLAIRRMLKARGAHDLPRPPRRSGKPVLLIPLEAFKASSAVFRCFAHALAGLRRHFHTVALAHEDEIDEVAKGCFDRVQTLSGPMQDPPKLCATVARIAPDAVLFPCLGMRAWTVWLANLRLAPLQVVMGGVAATSASEHIDYFIAFSGNRFDTARFTERVLMLAAEDVAYTDHDAFPAELLPCIREKPDVLVIAVLANALKLNACLLDTYVEIAARAGRRVQFRFFPFSDEFQRQALQHQLSTRLPDVVVEPRASYADYLYRLRECDLALGSFPFGSSNSTNDALGLCIPWVGWDGPELHSGCERSQLEREGLPDWLMADSAEAFIAAALRLIHDDELRVGMAHSLLAKRDTPSLAANAGRVADEVADVVHWVFRERAALAANSRRCWYVKDRHDWDAQSAGRQIVEEG